MPASRRRRRQRARRRRGRRRATTTTRRGNRRRGSSALPLRQAGPEFRERHAGQPRPLLPQSLPLPAAGAPRHRAPGRRRGAAGRRAVRPRRAGAATRCRERMLPRLLDGEALADVRDFARAGIEYPPGRLGDLELEQELQRLDALRHALAPVLARPTLDPVSATLEFALDGEPWRLTGGFGDLRASGLVRYRYDDARAHDYLNGWIEHLFLNAMAPPEVGAHDRPGTRATATTCCRPWHDARARLAALLGLYRDGLHRPLHFFPKSAWSYVVQGESLVAGRRHVDEHRLSPPMAKTATRPTGWRCAVSTTLSTPNSSPARRRCSQPLLEVIDDDRLATTARHEHVPAEFDVFDCTLDGVNLIEASAGTGKTWNICGLYLRLLLERDLDVQQILVVTFTNAATAELRERVRSRIVETLAWLRDGDDAAPPGDPFVPALVRRSSSAPAAPATSSSSTSTRRCSTSTRRRSSPSTASASARSPTRRSAPACPSRSSSSPTTARWCWRPSTISGAAASPTTAARRRSPPTCWKGATRPRSTRSCSRAASPSRWRRACGRPASLRRRQRSTRRR